MLNNREIIVKLKAVREEKKLSYNDILDLMEANGDFVSKSTLSRVFAEGSEETNFRYEDTIRPIAKALLDIETIEADDDADVQAMKSLLKYKIKRIEELEQQVKDLESALAKEKVKAAEKLEKEREVSQRRINFLIDQVGLKDKRMDFLLDAVQKKDALHMRMLEQILNCPCRNRMETE